MAERRLSLKYLDGDGDIDPAAYRALTQRLFDLNAAGYQSLETKRPAYDWVTNSGAQTAYEQIQNSDGSITNVPITFATHRIKCNIDKDAMDDDRQRRRTNVSLPRIQPKTDADIDYLGDYIDLMGGMTRAEAIKFLFGMLLITKCR